MNGTEQRERFTAVSRVEKRVEDVELIVEQFARDIVADRVRLDQQHQELIDAVNAAIGTALSDARAHVDREDRKQEIALANFKYMTCWQRLRWLVRGV